MRLIHAFAFLILSINIQAQTIGKIDITDPIMVAILHDYIADCHHQHTFYGNKGIIIVSDASTDKQTKYWLHTEIDDRYKDSPPNRFGYIVSNSVYMILFYDKVKQPTVPPTELQQLSDEMGDRVYLRPSKQQRWTYCVDPKSKEPYWGYCTEQVLSSGGNWNSVSYILNSDGTFKKLRGL
jgi:hypothetical protein